ncbi:hypothetical protein BKA67DRAFT_532883 [Truncatella angustata]|uniref:Uncharacterized protein n=1 Tax=Truncatella angustata TaxID=152316 RepID=A0A9P8UTF3_9PEZI|nr:uncharacterized protein BKA67DRAFT_532883 [Truncatella angustata]KAH6657690.1 hypothetical protein BKA67DRAFT_532883 [Truncatella angustata]
MSAINVVKYYFYKGMIPKDPERLQKMVVLAYRTARDRQIYLKAVLIRSDIHDTTSINGVRQKDPKGDHVTLCYKDAEHISADSTRRRKGKHLWPSTDQLEEAPEIGYGDFP